jgi:hypothetical protein
MLKVTTRMFRLFKAMERPMSMTVMLNPCMMVLFTFSGKPPFRKLPRIVPAIMAAAFTMVPSIFYPPFLHLAFTPVHYITPGFKGEDSSATFGPDTFFSIW